MSRMTFRSVANALNKLKSSKKAAVSARYFKTERGQYGYGDIFIGVTVPEQRKIAKHFKELPLVEIDSLLKNKIHEYRLTGLLILTYKELDKEIYDFYMNHTFAVNNWDLVDVSAATIVGKYLFDKNRTILELLTQSEKIWERRIAVIATHYFIKQNDFDTTFTVVRNLLNDHHDLIHKAVGWTLREVGKKNKKLLTDFLIQHASHMPRTALRYATEHFSPSERHAIVRA